MIKKVKLHLKLHKNQLKKVLYLVLLKHRHKQVQQLQNLFIKLKEMMMMNGLPQLSSIQNYLKSKNNSKKCVNKNLKRRLKNNQISKSNKKNVKKKDKKNNIKNIINFNNNKQDFMIRDKERKNKIIKRKFNYKRK